MLLGLLTACASSSHKTYNVSTHKVRKGETLYSIAWRYDLDYKDVARWNNVRSPYRIYVGQELWLSPRYSAAKSSSAKPKVQAKKSPQSSAQKKPAAKNAQKKYTQKSQKDTARYPTGRIQWQWPANGKVIKTYSTSNQGKKGIDIAGKRGQPVVAAAAGKVVYGGIGLKGYGKLVIIKHNNILFSAYAHNNKILVQEGSWVKRGQKIAEIGNTDADRYMLHFEIRRDGNPVNPMRYLPKR